MKEHDMGHKMIYCAILIIFFHFFVLSVSSLWAGGQDPAIYDQTYGEGDAALVVATGSPGALGLLEALAEPFCRLNHCRINWVKKGSGASLRALKTGQVHMVMVHAPEAEKKAVQEGWGQMRVLLGSNEFLMVGPGSDPAGIASAKSIKEAFSRIAGSRARFFSRGDNSGTHKKEMKVWEKTGITPSGSWYVVTGDFMGPTLMRADLLKGYFMVDSSTYYAKRSKIKNLKVLYKGDPMLVNIYHALVVAKGNEADEGVDLAVKFVEFLGSPQGQKIFREYGKNRYGVALYNDAEYAKKWDR